MRRASLLVVALVAISCGGSSPTAPSVAPPPQPSKVTLTARITDTVSGRAVPGASVTIDGFGQTQTGGDGTFAIEASARPSVSHVSITATGYLARDTQLQWSGSAVIDLIPDAAPFSLDFYRQFVRNTFDHPETMEPLRRWTHAPMVYLRTVDEAGEPIPLAQLDSTEAVLRSAAGDFTASRFGLAGVERGTETREGQRGWITVVWMATSDGDFCGKATVGTEGSLIWLYYKRGGGCACGSLLIRPRTVRHELGHALGYWHTGNAADLMSGLGVNGCDQPMSARERFHANVAYSRQPGNTDIDRDATSTTLLLRAIEIID